MHGTSEYKLSYGNGKKRTTSDGYMPSSTRGMVGINRVKQFGMDSKQRNKVVAPSKNKVDLKKSRTAQ